jgi:hypothetical protein
LTAAIERRSLALDGAEIQPLIRVTKQLDHFALMAFSMRVSN